MHDWRYADLAVWVLSVPRPRRRAPIALTVRTTRSCSMSDYGYALDELEVGMSASFGKTITDADILMFAGVSGDTNPVHLNEEFAGDTPFKGRIAHGMLTASLISTALGTKLPGAGCVYLAQTMKFLAPVRAGETVRAVVTVKEIEHEKRRVTMETVCKVSGKDVLVGEAKLLIPARESQAAA
jgi:3-hydroxybutyryl-CoA dehydratase